MTEPLLARVSEVLEGLRRELREDGTEVELLGLEGEIAVLRLSGLCLSCPSMVPDLLRVIEGSVKEAVPEIARVVLR